MKKFTVCFDRSTSEQIAFSIEAEDEDQAHSQALEMLGSQELEDMTWEPTDYVGDAEVVYVAEEHDES